MEHITRGASHLAMQITGSRDDALDILQNAVVKALEYRNAPRPDDAGYKAWFYRVVHNQAVDWLRREKKFDRQAQVDEVADEHDPESDLAMEQRKQMLHKALDALAAEQREIICLKDFHDFSYNDIAAIMDIERGTVMSRLHRARLALRDKLVALENESGERDGM